MTAGRSAVVLAGGRSQRMGREKALLEVGGVTLLEGALRTLAGGFDALYVSVGWGGASDGLRTAVERFQASADRPVGIVEDRLENLGPVAGIHAALEAIEGDRAFFLAVDLPRISFPLVDVLWEETAREGCPGCMPSIGGRLEPVFAVYSRPLAARIPPLAASGRLRLQDLCQLEGFRIVDLDEPRWRDRVFTTEGDPVARASSIESLFRNINTPDDYRAWVAELDDR